MVDSINRPAATYVCVYECTLHCTVDVYVFVYVCVHVCVCVSCFLNFQFTLFCYKLDFNSFSDDNVGMTTSLSRFEIKLAILFFSI